MYKLFSYIYTPSLKTDFKHGVKNVKHIYVKTLYDGELRQIYKVKQLTPLNYHYVHVIDYLVSMTLNPSVPWIHMDSIMIIFISTQLGQGISRDLVNIPMSVSVKLLLDQIKMLLGRQSEVDCTVQCGWPLHK